MAEAPFSHRQALLCADDYGYSEAVCHAIVDLACDRRLGALGVMTAGPHWPGAWRLLESVPKTVAIGLHCNLTEGHALSGALRFEGAGRLALAAYTGRLESAALRRELAAQWQVFVDQVGRPPDFVDTHQHVHLLPAVSQALLELLESQESSAPVRALWPAVGPSNARVKRWAFFLLGAPGLSRMLAAQGRAANRAFGGLQAFEAMDRVEQDWTTLLARLPEGALVACHPARAAQADDPIGAFRLAEYAWLRSAQFLEASHAAGISWADSLAGFRGAPQDRSAPA